MARGRDSYPSIDRGHAVGSRDHRVQVELTDLGYGVREEAQADQRVLDGIDVDGRRAAVAVEQRRAPQRLDELAGFVVGDGGDANPAIAEQLGCDAAHTEDEERAERVVSHDAPINSTPGCAMGWTSAPVIAGPSAAYISCHALVTAFADRSPSATPPTSDLCTISGPSAFSTTG